MDNSYWLDSVNLKQFPKLEKDLETDVSTAYYLTKNGYDVCILEKNKVASHTTRKYYC